MFWSENPKKSPGLMIFIIGPGAIAGICLRSKQNNDKITVYRNQERTL